MTGETCEGNGGQHLAETCLSHNNFQAGVAFVCHSGYLCQLWY